MILKSQGSKKPLKYCSSYINSAFSSLFCNGFMKTHSSSSDIWAVHAVHFQLPLPILFTYKDS